jgi:hypothetical protein
MVSSHDASVRRQYGLFVMAIWRAEASASLTTKTSQRSRSVAEGKSSKIPSRSGRNRLAANSCLAAFGTKTCSYVEIIDHGSRVARRMVEMLRSYHWLAAVQTAIVALDEAALDDEERE